MTLLIGVCGGSGSGKTTFVQKIVKRVGAEHCAVIHMDSYYLDEVPPDLYLKSQKPNFDHPEAFDWELLTQHLLSLKQGQAIEAPLYDFTISSRDAQTQTIPAKPVILFEGIFTLYNESLRKLLDICCFLHVESDIRFSRRLHRDVNERGRSLESIINQYFDSVRPMYQKYLEPQKQYADFIVGEETDVASEILSARIQQFLLAENQPSAFH
jgi:uridine kinase